MAESDIFTMSQKEMKRLQVIHNVREGLLKQKQAAEIISLSERQIRRIVKRIRDEGDKGIQHRSRGKKSNRRLPNPVIPYLRLQKILTAMIIKRNLFTHTLRDGRSCLVTLSIVK